MRSTGVRGGFAIAVLLFGSFVLPAASAAPSPSPSLCQAGERVVFACTTGPRQVSLCEAPVDPARGARLQYRYGRVGSKSELAFPSDEDSAPGFRAGTASLSGGGGAWLEFERGRFRYVVFSFWIRGKGEVAGVAVEADGKRQLTLRCRGAARSALGPDYFSAAGFPPADRDFLP